VALEKHFSQRDRNRFFFSAFLSGSFARLFLQGFFVVLFGWPLVLVCCSLLQRGVLSDSVLQCVAVRCCVLQWVVVHCRVLQCVAVCCSVLSCVAVDEYHNFEPYLDRRSLWNAMYWL